MHTGKSISYPYDAVIVLGMNIRPTAVGFRPASYDDHDEFGMLGGEMNVIAASLLHEQQASGTFVFSTGTSKKTAAAFGPGVPTEAEVYSQDFLQRIKESAHPMPTIILEKNSVNTYSNLTECIQIINKYGWKKIAIMSARYHTPRVAALWELACQQHPVEAKADILIAEDVVTASLPGIYDKKIEQAYASEWGIKRAQIEKQGIEDLRSGRYVVTEFQLAK
jgi:uncharacterized SAM-binding protein YcdF (DUF218 family)